MMQNNLVRESVEDRARDILKWTKSAWKNDNHKVSGDHLIEFNVFACSACCKIIIFGNL